MEIKEQGLVQKTLQFLRKLNHPEDYGWAVSSEVRKEALSLDLGWRREIEEIYK